MKSLERADQVHRRAVIWIDHPAAKIFAMGLTSVRPTIVHARLYASHLHHHANAVGSGHVGQDPACLATIGKAVEFCDDVLILGNGKSALIQYLRSSRPQIVLRTETSDHPTEEEIVAIARKHFAPSRAFTSKDLSHVIFRTSQPPR